ncbi:hypothetical protein [Mesorhizobium sp. M7A.F.Ca.CA.001.13.1.1]|uniref:hypothetical protein n=1 Tax=Mesorhizobium sp. M7A.F.Ca.CA.001.13.1.1 TaxID=2496728 RepID=UPI0013E0C4AB|nr:hypothetical protein [Mesorhizobium sp. M7A.F.Ca.CA.001.13.1.1]
MAKAAVWYFVPDSRGLAIPSISAEVGVLERGGDGSEFLLNALRDVRLTLM